jgi:MoaA/NifB/PqqE/SkfB family radical SAM enzyme
MDEADCVITENKNFKRLKSKECNYYFNKKTGLTLTWGTTLKDDPKYNPYGPIIADIEISTICNGLGKPCSFCYKSNTPKGENMSLETFKKIFHRIPKTLTQIAFGIGNIDENKELFDIMEYCRNNDYNQVVPNITINGFNLTDEYADKLASICGAVAVSKYNPKDVCYDAVKKLTDRGMTQVNCHMLVSHQTFDSCMELMSDTKTDPRLEKLNAIVFLSLKPKGKRNTFKKIANENYKKIIDYAMENDIRIGFDSCSAPKFLEAVKDRKDFKTLFEMSEPCEAQIFSIYINVDGKTSPCSFLEDLPNYEMLDVLNCTDFKKDIWDHLATQKFRESLLKTEETCTINGNPCRKCPEFDIY